MLNSSSPIPRFALIAAGALALAASVLVLAAGKSTKDGAFTEEQAARGKLVYDKTCINCHQPDFYQERLTRWNNKPVKQLYDAVSTTMPADNVGSLSTAEYVDVLAYIFSITGSPAGGAELTTETMDSISVAAP
jgi:mono/diheme cytochrome c family protein